MAARKPRLSSEETKSKLIDAGIQALCSSGMSVGLDSVNLEQAVRDADVSRSSAYAVWSNSGYSPQEEFQREVLLRAISDRRKTLEELNSHVGALYDSLCKSGLSPREVMRELIRQTSAKNVRATADSIGWKLVIALRAVLHSAPPSERSDELVEWMNEQNAVLSQYTTEEVHKPMAAAFKLEPRPEYGERAWELAEVCASAVSEGFAMRYWLGEGDYVDGVPHPASNDGEANWGLFGLLYEQIVETFFIPTSGSWDEFV